ncbi:MAG: GAF domain-containing protein [Candidatus Eremiobacteraeota bacterium]|nr:GAF domain-containing protein [Candidatus Eremiobacteraeota bacterium]
MGTPRTVLAQGLGFLTERLGAERAIVHYAGFGVTHGFEAATLWTTGELSHTLIQSLLDEAEPMIFYDAVKHNKFKHQTSAVLSSLRSVLFVPLVSRQAKLAGFLYADNREKSGAFNDEHLQAAIAFAHNQLTPRLHQAFEADFGWDQVLATEWL